MSRLPRIQPTGDGRVEVSYEERETEESVRGSAFSGFMDRYSMVTAAIGLTIVGVCVTLGAYNSVMNNRLERENATLETENSALEQENAALSGRVGELERRSELYQEAFERAIARIHPTETIDTVVLEETGADPEQSIIDTISGGNEEIRGYLGIIQDELSRYDNSPELNEDLLVWAAAMFFCEENPDLDQTYVAPGDHATTLAMLTQGELKEMNRQGQRYWRRTENGVEKWDWEDIAEDTGRDDGKWTGREDAKEDSLRLGTVMLQYRVDKLTERFPELAEEGNRIDLFRAIAAAYNAGNGRVRRSIGQEGSVEFLDYITRLPQKTQKQTVPYVIKITAYYKGLKEGKSVKELRGNAELLFSYVEDRDMQRYVEFKTGMSLEEEGIFYTVQNGDSVGKIARYGRCSEDELMEANGMEGDNLRVGQRIRLPHELDFILIQNGDVPGSLAQRYGLETDDIKSIRGFNAGNFVSVRAGSVANPDGRVYERQTVIRD